jgi:hypothetical protein
MRTSNPSTTALTIAVTLLMVLTGLSVAIPGLQGRSQPVLPSSLTIVWDNGGPAVPERALSSQRDAVYPFSSQAADDFRLPSDTAISMIQWWGVVWQAHDIVPSDFQILFYADDGSGSRPTGAGLEDPSATALAVYDLPQVSWTMVSDRVYEYNVTLSSPFLASANTTYWLAVQSQGSLADQGQWGWEMTNTSGMLAESVQGFPLTGTPYWSAMGAGDRAFRLGRETMDDILPPVTTCSLNGTMDDGIYTSNVTVTLNATDDSSGVNYTMVKVDNSSYTQYLNSYLVSGAGNHTVWFYSVDYAGNQELEKNVSFTILATIQLNLKVILGLGVHVFITNSGTMDAVAVPWNISVNGDHVFFGKNVNGTVDVPAGNEVLVRDFVIGLGQTTITVNAGGLTKSTKAVVLIFFLVTTA